MTRRELLLSFATLPLVTSCADAHPPAHAPPLPAGQRLRVLCVGGHPDDPEAGCGGTLARYAEAGHDVHILYVTKGELGIEGKTPAETGAIRAAEAEEACRALGATPHFLERPSGQLVFSPETLLDLIARFDRLGPDVIFGHWPIDTDYDHGVAALLTTRAYLAKPRRYPLYYYEVETGTQTLAFEPRTYVEIGSVLPRKLAAIRAHRSQNAEERLYERHHEPMERFRAREIGGVAAEAFAELAPDARTTNVPGLS